MPTKPRQPETAVARPVVRWLEDLQWAAHGKIKGVEVVCVNNRRILQLAKPEV